MIPTAQIICGDAREVLKTLETDSVHCCVTSPPYWGLRDYKTNGQIGLEQTPHYYVAELVKIFREVRRVLKPDGTLWVNLGDTYASGNRATFRSVSSENKGHQIQDGMVRPKTPPGLKEKDLVGIPWRLAFALQEDGWWLRQDIIWHKPNPMPESVTDRCTKAHEYIFLLSKSSKYWFDHEAIKEPVSSSMLQEIRDGYKGKATKNFAGAGAQDASDVKRRIIENARAHGKWSTQDRQSSGKRITDNVARARSEGGDHDNPFGMMRNKRSVWTVPTCAYKDAHFAVYPPNLIKPCIIAGCPPGGTVLDPFAGSGTTGKVALELGRNAILIELNPEYAQLCQDRCNVTPAFPF